MSSARTQLLAHSNAANLNNAEEFIANFTEEQCQQILSGWAQDEAERDALRNRLAASPQLRQVTCPSTSWGSAESRYEVTKTAVAILEVTAEKNQVTLEALVAAIANNNDGIQHRIELHGTDPRLDGFRPGQGFQAFRCAVRDALNDLKAEETKAARLAAEAKRDAVWAAQGLTRCTRCGGAGGHKGWPGFTCYGCDGHGAV